MTARGCGVSRIGWVVSTILLIGALFPSGAVAQDLGLDEPAVVRLVVTGLDGLVGPALDPTSDGDEDGEDDGDEVTDLDLRVLVENEGAVDVSNLQVVAEVFPPVGGARSVLHQALDDQTVPGLHRAIARVDVRDGDDLLAGAIAGEQLAVDGTEIGWRGTNGVYPVQVSVLSGSEVLDQVVTAVVHLTDLQAPLQTTLVWPLSAPTSRTASGQYAEAVPDELAPGGRLDVLLSTVERRPDVPVVLAPESELVEELADRADGFTLVDGTEIATDDPAATHAGRLLDRIQAAVEDSPLPPVTGPYGRADVAALAAAPNPISQLAPLAIETARLRTEALLGRAPAEDLYLSTTPMTPAAMELLDPDTHLLLPAGQVTGSSQLADELSVAHARMRVATNPSEPRACTGGHDCPLASVADADLARLLADPPVEDGPVVTQQRLVAETALLYLARPAEQGRGLLVLPPIHWSPTRGVPELMVSALLDSPWLTLTTPTHAPPGPQGVTTLNTTSTSLPTTVSTELTGANDQLAALRAAMPDGLPDLAGQTVSDLEDALLRALTPEMLEDGGADALSRIRAVRRVTETAFGSVSLIEGTPVTLASDTGPVPITLRRTGGGDIELIVEVESRAGLIWESGGQQQRVTLPEGSSRTVSFDTRAVARGQFPVTVSVWDPTKSKLLDSATLSVRSTSISRNALIIIGSVVVVLLAVGVRRRRSPSLEVVR